MGATYLILGGLLVFHGHLCKVMGMAVVVVESETTKTENVSPVLVSSVGGSSSHPGTLLEFLTSSTNSETNRTQAFSPQISFGGDSSESSETSSGEEVDSYENSSGGSLSGEDYSGENELQLVKNAGNETSKGSKPEKIVVNYIPEVQESKNSPVVLKSPRDLKAAATGYGGGGGGGEG